MENKDTSYLATMLRKYRESNALTQEFVASQLNISRSAYSYYEIGKTEPNIKSLCILAKMFGISLEDFLPTEPTFALHDSSAFQKAVQSIPTSVSMRSLSVDERQLVVLYRLANPKEKKKIIAELTKAKNA